MDNLDLVLNGLKFGKLILYPTDTCLGFGHDIFSQQGLAKLYEVKQMPLGKPVSVLVNSLLMAEEYVEFNEIAFELWKEFMPGKLTLLLPRKEKVPEFLNPGNQYLGVRHIDLPVVNKLIQSLGNPISTTSANRHGEAVLTSMNTFIEQFGHALGVIDLLLDETVDYANEHSTIVKLSNNKIDVVREGALIDQLNKKFGAYIN